MKIYSNVIKNISLALMSRFVSIGVAIFSVPMLLQLLGTEIYGIWATLVSLIAFIGLLDLGMGNSLKNSVAVSLNESQVEILRNEFVALFQLLCLVSVVVVFAFGVALSVSSLLATNLVPALILFIPPIVFLPTMLGSSVLQGARATGLQAVLQALGGWFFFIFVLVCYFNKLKPNLAHLALVWSVLYALSAFGTFYIALKILRLPTTQLFCINYKAFPQKRLKVSISFLILQLSSFVLFNLGNMLVYQYLGSEDVARYDVVNKLFQAGLSIFTIVIGVVWPEIARNRATKNFVKLLSIYKYLIFIAIIFCTGSVLIGFAAPWIINYWTQQKVQVTTNEAFSIAALVSVQSFAYVGAVFMNSFERIRVQIVFACISIALMVPLSSWLISKNFGIMSVPLASMIMNLLPAIFCNRQAILLIHMVGRE